MPSEPLTAAELEERLDEVLDPALSSRRTAAGPAAALARLDRTRQDFVLHWVAVIAKTNAELAYQFAAHAHQALGTLALEDAEAWIVQALDVYDRQGLYPGCAVFQDVAGFAARVAERDSAATFDEVAGMLEGFLRGLSGRRLTLQPDEAAWCDGETVYLPARLAVFPERGANRRLYKACAVHQWALTRYGSFRVDMERVAAGRPDPGRAARLYHTLETLRLDAVIARELPGLGREMAALQEAAGAAPLHGAWRESAGALADPGATPETSLAWLGRLYGEAPPPPRCYQGAFRPDQVAALRAARLEREKAQLRRALWELAEGLEGQAGTDSEPERGAAPRQFRLAAEPGAEPEAGDWRLTLDGKPVAPPEAVRGLLQSVWQDLGQIPDEYLVAAGDGAYHAGGDPRRRAEEVWKGPYHEEGAFLYNEWDHRRQHYRKDWCVLRELDVHPGDPAFAADTLARYAGLAASLRKTFEVLRGEDRLLKRQKQGDEVDLDALVEALADGRAGREITDRLFTRPQRIERNIAVMFMVDMSGSTKGWINDAEREALVLLCEALEVLGDRYAIYGFSGMTRKRCELYRVKRFDEPYSDTVRGRISGIQPRDYTRMGVTIRHLSRLLKEVEARTKLLVTLSDGKPDDYDGYRGEYGIEDTRQALIEAKREGIHTFCITLDTEARDYLPHMYGAANYALVDDVRRLPIKVSDIYRRLTS